MAEVAAVFDILVFDPGVFDSLEVSPTLFKVEVAPEHRKVAPGQTVGITVYMVNVETTPGRSFLFSPGEAPTILILDPSETILVNYLSMTNQGTGIYHYQYQLDNAAPLGAYSIRLRCSNGSKNMRTVKYVAFQVIAGGT